MDTVQMIFEHQQRNRWTKLKQVTNDQMGKRVHEVGQALRF